MRKVVFFVLFFALHSITHASDNISEFDGNKWNEWNETVKVNYVQGFMAGSGYVANSLIQPLFLCSDLEKAKKNQEKFWAERKQKKPRLFSTKEVLDAIFDTTCVNDSNYNDQVHKYHIVNITVGQLSDGLDIFFSDFKNKSIPLTDATYFVKKQIEGLSNEDEEHLLIFIRGGKKNFQELQIKTDQGEVRHISFP